MEGGLLNADRRDLSAKCNAGNAWLLSSKPFVSAFTLRALGGCRQRGPAAWRVVAIAVKKTSEAGNT